MNFFASQPPDGSATTAPEQAYQHLSHAIRMGHMKPGARLVADEVANAIGMSRMPVREALRRLASEGLLVMPPNRGAIVRELSESEVVEVFEMRAVLEGLAAAMAARRQAPRDIADLEDLLACMQRCGSDRSQWITLHRQFHTRLCAISAAPRLLQQIAALHSVIEPLLRIWLAEDLDCGAEQALHRQLLTRLQSGEPEPFEQAMRAHARATAQRITRAMRVAQSGGSVA